MKIKKFSKKPEDSEKRTNAKAIICYPNESLENGNLNILHEARKYLKKEDEILIPPRDAKTFNVKAGKFFRVESVEGNFSILSSISKVRDNSSNIFC